jgi:S-adenosylmethionine:tRNA ribosyltransferase-isomerase
MELFFDYELPEHLIAQEPAANRDESRLLVVRRDSGALEHRAFRDLSEVLRPGDLLVLNDTKVIPARVIGRREQTGGKWEGLFLRE